MQITCATCSSKYIGKTCCHFKIEELRIEKHIKKITSLMFLNIYTQLQHALTRLISFKIIDKANSKSDLKIKEALHISSRKPNLNMPQNHLALTIAFVPLVVFYLCFFFVSFSSIIFMTLIMGICYCLNYTLLLPHYNTPYTTPFSFIYCFHYL